MLLSAVSAHTVGSQISRRCWSGGKKGLSFFKHSVIYQNSHQDSQKHEKGVFQNGFKGVTTFLLRQAQEKPKLKWGHILTCAVEKPLGQSQDQMPLPSKSPQRFESSSLSKGLEFASSCSPSFPSSAGRGHRVQKHQATNMKPGVLRIRALNRRALISLEGQRPHS